MDHLYPILSRVAEAVATYRQGLPTARVSPSASRSEVRAALDPVLPEVGEETGLVLDQLVAGAQAGLMGSAGPRYFGFVVGGSPDAALAADWLTSGWDQVAFNEATSPAALAFEDVAGGWLKDLLGIPATASVGFVTGAQAANTVGLATGRWKVLHDVGWDVGLDGLFQAPEVRVVVGEERHATIDRSLRLLGLGEKSLTIVPARADGGMDAAALEVALEATGPLIVCAQAGNVNTGAFDDLRAIGGMTRDRGAWLHVDGAFGLWAGASAKTRHLVDGVELADSWGCDGHKWLNVPYDSGYAFCRDPDIHATALAYTAAYLTGQDAGRIFGGGDFVPESSRRARGFATWAALRSLGRSGIESLVDRGCSLARRFADGVSAIPGCEVVNEVVLNQVLVRVGNTGIAEQVEQAIQAEGVVWMGGTTWRGERLLRFSVSNWATGDSDIDAAIEAVARARAAVVDG
jgi:glutamate/tyrosine decarboxylase-like PLP-dependent enzyme